MYQTLKKFLCGLGLISMFCLVGCSGEDGVNGSDGVDGTAYLRMSWLYDPLVFSDDNPDTPTNGINNWDYDASPGIFSYEYTAWDNSTWIGVYSIYINEGELGEPGESGGMFGQNGADGADGADGRDICFELTCYAIGPSFYAWDCYSTISVKKTNEMNMEKASMPDDANFEIAVELLSKMKTLTKFNPSSQSSSTTDWIVEEGQLGIYRFEHKYKKVK